MAYYSNEKDSTRLIFCLDGQKVVPLALSEYRIICPLEDVKKISRRITLTSLSSDSSSSILGIGRS